MIVPSRVDSLRRKEDFLVVGLMSGTSMDGVDAALVSLKGKGEVPKVSLLGFSTLPYPEELKTNLMDVAMGSQVTARELATLQTSVAVAFANAFFAVVGEVGVEAEAVDFIGSHGQTIAHVPPPTSPIAGTLQVGPPGMIAALTGVTTVGDFRVGDMALGGQGAPLSPYVDYLLRRSEARNRVILNIGGIANVTYLPRGGRREDTLAFDTGPGNMVIDALFRALYPGKGGFDREGERAGQGQPDMKLVDKWLGLPYFSQSPPKSAGHGEFGAPFAWEFLSQARAQGLTREDVLATAVMLTVKSIAQAVDRFVKPKGGVDEVFVSGGGSRNATLLSALQTDLSPAQVLPIDELGIPAEAKEAVDFCVLAREAILGRVNVISSATGATEGQVLGTIAVGRGGRKGQ